MVGSAGVWKYKLGVILLLGSSPAALFAHAVLQKSDPAANGAIDGPEHAIVLTYNSRIDAAHSSLSLVAPDGKASFLTVEQASEPDVLRAEAHGLRKGHYSLRWQVVASDGHVTRGVVAFDVR